jgi:hypothetical protein
MGGLDPGTGSIKEIKLPVEQPTSHPVGLDQNNNVVIPPGSWMWLVVWIRILAR